MLTKDQADRIATAIRVVRPEWNHPQLMAVLAIDDIRVRRTYHDTFHAALAIALDDNTRQPTRLLEAGPWWNARPDKSPAPGVPLDWRVACARCLKPRDHLWHSGFGSVNDCEFLDPADHARAVAEVRSGGDG